MAAAISSSIMPYPLGRDSSLFMGGIFNISKNRNNKKPAIRNLMLNGIKMKTKSIDENSSITISLGSFFGKSFSACEETQNPIISKNKVREI